MLWKRRDMGSDPMKPIFVAADIPTIDNDQFVEVRIPIAAYKRLVDWCSIGRTMDNVVGCLADGSPDESRRHIAYSEMEELRESLTAIHGAIRNHYVKLPGKTVT